MVDQRIVANRRIDAQRHRDANRHEQTREGEFQGRRQPLGDQLDHRLAKLERPAKVAAHGAGKKIPVLDHYRLIQAQLVAQPGDIFGRGIVAEHQSDRISRRDMH